MVSNYIASRKFSIFLLALLAIFSLAYFYYNPPTKEAQENLVSPKETAAIVPPPLPDKIFGLAGKIVSKSSSSLTLEINSLKDRAPVNGAMPKEKRTVRINEATSIKELMFSRAKLGSPPTEKTITLNNLQVGDQVIVTANENIKEKNAFTASLIQKHVFE